MRFHRNLASIAVAGLVCCALAPAAGTSPARFPALVTYNLEKAKVKLPSDFEGEMNLLILPFELEQQNDADSWTPVVKEVQASRPGFRHYLVPVFSRENFLYRWWMNSSLRSRLPANEQRQSTIPLYLSRRGFLRQLQISSDREITVLLVEKDGRVLWRTTGALTEAKRASLETALVTSGNLGR